VFLPRGVDHAISSPPSSALANNVAASNGTTIAVPVSANSVADGHERLRDWVMATVAMTAGDRVITVPSRCAGPLGDHPVPRLHREPRRRQLLRRGIAWAG
jgi:hypothetical protein